MNMEKIFDHLKEIVKKELSCSAHGIEHTERVYNLAVHIAKDENVDMDIIKAAALLHDIGRAKEDQDNSGKSDHAVIGAEMAEKILKAIGFPEDKIGKVSECILTHRSRSDRKQESKEAQILFDADKIDCLGAIGIARSFAWVGKNKAHIFREVPIEEYIKENMGGKINGRIQDKTKHSPQIEFETKSRFVVDHLHTKKAKEIGKERLDYYKSFLDRLKKEIKGEL